MFRVEDKFSCTPGELYLLQARIGTILHPDDNQTNDDGYSVISVYFDDLYDTHLMDTIDGNSSRNKYRIRIYDNSFNTIKLEVKTKHYNRIKKSSRTITYSQMRQFLDGQTIEAPYLPNDPITLFNIAIKERGLHPVIIVAYERKAFVFDPGNVRITFDRNIRFCKDIQSFGQPDATYEIVDEMDCVLEMKYDEFMPSFITQLLETGNMQQVSYSKYQLSRSKQKI